jgi:hypothetical protein
MGKKKKPAVEAFDKQGPATLAEGYTWCPECQASFQGKMCPGCVDLSGAGAKSAPEPAGAEAPPEGCPVCNVVGPGKTGPIDETGRCFHCGREIILQEETGPTTLAEVAEQASVETTTITEILPVPLTDAEHKEISQRMAAANQEIAQIEIDLKAVKSQFKSRKESAEARRNECSDFINAGHQQKQVECSLVKDFNENTITLIRQDTGEIVRTRTMSPPERQRGLDFGKED